MLNLREWRVRILDGILRGIFVIWLFALASGINNVINAYQQDRGSYENPTAVAVSVIGVYLGVTFLLALITFNRKVRYELRAGLLLFIFYLIGTIGLSLSSLSGDGRIFLFAFIILAAVLFDLRASLVALGASLLTLIVVGWLEISQIIVVPAQLQINAVNPNAWMSGGIVFFVLSVAVLISVAYILRALEQLYEQSQAKASEMERLYAASRDMSASLMDTPALLQTLARHMAESVNATSANIMSINPDSVSMLVLAEYWAVEAGSQERVPDFDRAYPINDFPTVMSAMMAGEVVTLHPDDQNLSDQERKQFADYGVKSMLFIPIMAHGKLIGDAEIWESRRHREFTHAEVDLEWAMASQAGSIIENSRLFAQTRQRESELESLVEVSIALRSASNRSEMLPILLRHAVKVGRGAIASIYLLEPETGDLISSGWYFRDEQLSGHLIAEPVLRHRPGQGVTGHVFQTGEMYETKELYNDPVAIVLPGEAERFKNIQSGISLPLRSNENIIGVLHVWLDESRSLDNSEIRLLTAVAEIAGNSLHRARLHEQTLLHAQELALAYDNTLAGWARALELRDELTEGHTRRVTEVTVTLARRMGLSEPELLQVRRGAILHDIGKMAVPDAILRKTGPLDEKELKTIRLHPQHAHDMLSSISFLLPALDIPYCHHEHWDGSGYPRGLKGEEIPLSARIFAVADVWDALTSDRPYRKAWSKEKTAEYIRENSGKYFDPHVVDVFLSMLPQL